MRIARFRPDRDPWVGTHTNLEGTTDTGAHPGNAVSYDGTTTGSGADTVQEAIDELAQVAGYPHGPHVYVVGDKLVADGTQSTFITSNEFEPGTAAAWVNGARTEVTEAATYDAVTFTGIPPVGAVILLDYLLAMT